MKCSLSKSVTSLSIFTSKSLCLQSFFLGCLTEITKVCVPFFEIFTEKDERNRSFPLKQRIMLLSSEGRLLDGFNFFFTVIRKQLSDIRIIL